MKAIENFGGSVTPRSQDLGSRNLSTLSYYQA